MYKKTFHLMSKTFCFVPKYCIPTKYNVDGF